jgi:hypothetical protein
MYERPEFGRKALTNLASWVIIAITKWKKVDQMAKGPSFGSRHLAAFFIFKRLTSPNG